MSTWPRCCFISSVEDMLVPLDFELLEVESLSLSSIYLSTSGFTPGIDTAIIVAPTSATSTQSRLRKAYSKVSSVSSLHLVRQ